MKTEVRIHHNMAGWLLKLLPSVKILTLRCLLRATREYELVVWILRLVIILIRAL
jgi:hypothetical protein